jgi:hypothetical protein
MSEVDVNPDVVWPLDGTTGRRQVVLDNVTDDDFSTLSSAEGKRLAMVIGSAGSRVFLFLEDV